VVEDSLFCDSACMLSLPVASDLVPLLMAALPGSVRYFHPEAAVAAKNPRVDQNLVHPQLGSGFQDQGSLNPPELAAAGLHWFAAVKILTAELKYPLRNAGPVEYGGNLLDRCDLLVGIPADVALVRHVHQIGRGGIVGLDRIHHEVLVRVAPGTPKALVGRLVGFVRDSGRWLGRHGCLPRHQKMRVARLHEL